MKKIRQETKEVKTCLSAPHTVKGFAHDLTVISPNISAHSSALKIVDQKASTLDLKLKPEKYVSFLHDGKDIDKRSTFALSHGSTHNISVAPWKVLGHILAVSPTGSQKASAKKLEDKLLQLSRTSITDPFRRIQNLDSQELPLAPSLYFQLMVDLISENALAALQCKLTKFIKRWLSLPQCSTLTTVYHPEILNLPFLPHCRKQEKLSMAGAVNHQRVPLFT